MSLILMFIKYATSYQLKLTDKSNTHKNQLLLVNAKWVPSTDELSTDLREDHLKMYALYHIRYRNHDSFARCSLLLSGDIELNPGPIKNPCAVCQWNISKRWLFCKTCSIGCHKKCNPDTYHTNYICIQCKDSNMTSIDIGNLTTLHFSNI